MMIYYMTEFWPSSLEFQLVIDTSIRKVHTYVDNGYIFDNKCL